MKQERRFFKHTQMDNQIGTVFGSLFRAQAKHIFVLDCDYFLVSNEIFKTEVHRTHTHHFIDLYYYKVVESSLAGSSQSTQSKRGIEEESISLCALQFVGRLWFIYTSTWFAALCSISAFLPSLTFDINYEHIHKISSEFIKAEKENLHWVKNEIKSQ